MHTGKHAWPSNRIDAKDSAGNTKSMTLLDKWINNSKGDIDMETLLKNLRLELRGRKSSIVSLAPREAPAGSEGSVNLEREKRQLSILEKMLPLAQGPQDAAASRYGPIEFHRVGVFRGPTKLEPCPADVRLALLAAHMLNRCACIYALRRACITNLMPCYAFLI